MQKVTVFRETPSDRHYRSLLYLQAQGQLELEFLDHKSLDWFLVKLWYQSAPLRGFLAILGIPEPRRREPSWHDLLSSLAFPLRLARRRTIVAAIAPYSMVVSILFLLKASGKKVIYYTSWPCWGTRNWVHRPRLGSRRMWGLFLRDLAAVGVTERSTDELTAQGAQARHIPHSVDTSSLVPLKKSQGPVLTLLYVGRLVREKGVLELSRVFQSLLERYPHLRLTMVGDGPELRELRHKEGTYCKGYVAKEEDLVREFQSADIFVLNSYEIDGWQELFGISLLEAMACGLPCVTTDCVGPRELVRDGISGFVIPQRDEQVLYRTLERLILDEELRSRLGARGRESAANYAVKTNAEKWLEMIQA